MPVRGRPCKPSPGEVMGVQAGRGQRHLQEVKLLQDWLVDETQAGRRAPPSGRGQEDREEDEGRPGQGDGLVPVGHLGGSVHLLLQAGSEVREAVDGWGTGAPRAVEGHPRTVSTGSEGSRETPTAAPAKGGARERAREGPSGRSRESAAEKGHGSQEGNHTREELPGSGVLSPSLDWSGSRTLEGSSGQSVPGGGGRVHPEAPALGVPGSGLTGMFTCAFLSPDRFWSFRSVPPECPPRQAAPCQQQHGVGLTWGPAWGPAQSPPYLLLQVSWSLSCASFSLWGFASPRTLLRTFPRDTPITSVHLVPA